MKMLNIFTLQLDWRQPWQWPRSFQFILFLGSGVLGALLVSPWWVQSWKAWDEASQAHEKWLAQQEEVQVLQHKTAQLVQSQNQLAASFADASTLSQLALQEGLQLSHLGLDKPQQVAGLNALQIHQQPVHIKVQGSWDGWMGWLKQLPVAAPGVTLTSLEIKADPRGGISAQVLAVAPQSAATESGFELSSVNLESGPQVDPFNVKGWGQTQRAYTEKHPSYARLVAPELLRPRDLLETFPRDRLLYVGHITSGQDVDALIQVLPPSGGKKEVPALSVHRVRVGSHLGQNFGKVLAVEPEQLVLQELALMPTGEWKTREVRLPLYVSTP